RRLAHRPVGKIMAHRIQQGPVVERRLDKPASTAPCRPMTAEGAEFDELVETYDVELRRDMAFSGETPDFFAEERVSFLDSCIREVGLRPHAILDYGCG